VKYVLLQCYNVKGKTLEKKIRLEKAAGIKYECTHAYNWTFQL